LIYIDWYNRKLHDSEDVLNFFSENSTKQFKKSKLDPESVGLELNMTQETWFTNYSIKNNSKIIMRENSLNCKKIKYSWSFF